MTGILDDDTQGMDHSAMLGDMEEGGLVSIAISVRD